MRWITAVALFAFVATAQAQTPLTGTQGPLTSTPPVAAGPVAPVPAPRRRGRTLQERFEAANTTHDGHLTQEQARAKMPAVARDFDAIDKDHSGTVTVEQIRAYAAERRAERRAARKATPR